MAIPRKATGKKARPVLSQTQVALYARVSSLQQAERGTIEAQRDFLAQWAARQGVAVVDQYFDDGERGALPLLG